MGCARVATRDTEIEGFADQRGRAGDGAARRGQRRRSGVRRTPASWSGTATSTGTSRSAAASTAASGRTWRASSSASRCASGTAGSPTTASSRAWSSSTPPGIRTLDASRCCSGPSTVSTSHRGARARTACACSRRRSPGRTVDVAADRAGRAVVDRRLDRVRRRRRAAPADQVRMLGVQASLARRRQPRPGRSSAARATTGAGAALPRRRRHTARSPRTSTCCRRRCGRSSTTPSPRARRPPRSRSRSPAAAAIERRRRDVRHDPRPPRARGGRTQRQQHRCDGRPVIGTSSDDRIELVDEFDEDDDDDGHLGHLLSSPVGGGGAVGRLLRRLFRPTRRRGGGGPPGADAPTHVTSSSPGRSGSRAASSGPARLARRRSPTRRPAARLSRVGRPPPPVPRPTGARWSRATRRRATGATLRRCPTASRCGARSPGSASA